MPVKRWGFLKDVHIFVYAVVFRKGVLYFYKIHLFAHFFLFSIYSTICEKDFVR